MLFFNLGGSTEPRTPPRSTPVFEKEVMEDGHVMINYTTLVIKGSVSLAGIAVSLKALRMDLNGTTISLR